MSDPKVKTLKIDDVDIGARSDQTVLEVAREHGIDIPTLCHLDGLSDVGACRLCLVEVKGQSKLFAACVTRVWEGMDVTTSSPRLQAYRKTILELLFAERSHVCAVCVANGHCELQSLAVRHGVTGLHVPYLEGRFDVDASHERFSMDQSRCVLCSRCVRVCEEIEGAHTWDVMGRGIGARVITDLREPWGTSDTCTNCGKCIHACPTGALSEKGRSITRKRAGLLEELATLREKRDV